MLTVLLPRLAIETLTEALRRSGQREVGGVMMAEHTGHNHFTVWEITVQRRGTFASFVRSVTDALSSIRQFFSLTGHDYTRFNYLGEWHSHPSFAPIPSAQDDSSMRQIVGDARVGANFAVLLIVKLDEHDTLMGTVHTYLPSGEKIACNLVFEDAFEDAITSTRVELAASDVQDGHGDIGHLAGSHEENTPEQQ
jgi:proteasome lid subunit RPN8/RPN11